MILELSWHVKASIFSTVSAGRSIPVQKISCISLVMFNSFGAFALHLPVETLTLSHLVYTCMPISTLHASVPCVAATFLISMRFLQVFGTPNLSQKAKE